MQVRAQVTRNAIFEAATQILETEGESRFNTNHIAERAGVSIGTLYQYFDNKEAILIEITRRESESTHALNRTAAKISDRQTMYRALVRGMIGGFDGFKGKPATRKAAIKAWMTAETPEMLGADIDMAASHLPKQPHASYVDKFILTRAVQSVVRAAVLENFKGLHSKAFEDGLVNLLEGYWDRKDRQRHKSK